MLKKIIVSLLAFSLFSPFVHAEKLEKTLSPHQREQLREYYESGKYFNDIDKKLVDARDYLDRQLKHPRKNPFAIVFDIDETALSNYRDLDRLSFTRNPEALTVTYMLGNAMPILPILALYQHAIQHHVAIFFISSRPNTPEMLAATVKNLKNAGFEQWEELTLKPIDKNNTVEEFKTQTRRHIAALGYDILLNIGDQDDDLQGGYAEAKVKIPNPFIA
jgi:predicted secreted acid phosphatase